MSSALAAHLTAEIEAEQHNSRCPSIVATVWRDGVELWNGAVGTLSGRPDGDPATAETAYRIGSITKTITAITVLQQVAVGHLELDAPVGEVLPELPSDIATVTPRALLMHGSGLLAEPSGPWWERSAGRSWAGLLPQLHRNPDLIGRFHYSNTGYAVLGQLVARCTGRSWWEVAREDVLAPLGMTATTYDAPTNGAPGLAVHPDAQLLHSEPSNDTEAMAPAGQLWSTVGDLGRLGTFLVRGDDALLPDALRHRMLTPCLVDDVPGRAWTRAYGFGVDVTDVAGVRHVGHGGSMPGFVSVLRVRPDGGMNGMGDTTGAVVAVLANSTAGHSADLAYRLLDLRDGDPRGPEMPDPINDAGAGRPTPAPAGAGQHLDLGGRWFWGPRPYLMQPRPGGALDLSPEGSGRGSHFTPTGPDAWIGQDEYFAGETLRVLQRGQASAYLDLGTFRFTRSPYDPSCNIPGGVDPAGWY